MFRKCMMTAVFVALFVLQASCNSVPPVSNNTPLPTGSQPAENTGDDIELFPATPVPSATIPVELSSLNGVEIRIIHPWYGESGIILRELIAQFNRENIWGINVFEEIGGSTSETARTYIENLPTSDRLNIVVLPAEYLAGWNETGEIIDLDPLIANPEWGLSKQDVEDFLPQAWNSNTLENRQIGIPTQVNLQFLVYNRTWAEELGFSSPPQTRDEFMDQVCTAAQANNFDNQKENDGTGGWIVNGSSQTILSWVNAFGGNKAWSNGKIALDQDETGEALTYLRELFGKGCAWNSRVASSFTYFSSRQTLAFSATLPDLLELEKVMTATENMDEWIIFPYPGKDEPPPVIMTGLSYGISKTNPSTELASWLFLRWMMLPRHQARLAEASGAIPAAKTAIGEMASYSTAHPWWETASALAPGAITLPPSKEWRLVRPVLEDSFWQMLQPTPLPIPTLLEQMDETIRSLPQ